MVSYHTSVCRRKQLILNKSQDSVYRDSEDSFMTTGWLSTVSAGTWWERIFQPTSYQCRVKKPLRKYTVIISIWLISLRETTDRDCILVQVWCLDYRNFLLFMKTFRTLKLLQGYQSILVLGIGSISGNMYFKC